MAGDRGKRVPVQVAFKVTGGEVGFSVGKYDPSYPLIIDPTYAWHTFYGSIGYSDYGNGIAVDRSGDVYVTGNRSLIYLNAWRQPCSLVQRRETSLC